MEQFLESTDTINWRHESLSNLAAELRLGVTDELTIAKRTFEWVRDQIQHSLDFERCEVTCRASDVLERRTGFCYAKSHLLAALLRANGIPAGFCYQRLSVSGDGPPFCLHGLNAVFLKQCGWYRVDPRGNKPGVDAQFAPPKEILAFEAADEGEADLPGILATPLETVVSALNSSESVQDLARCLPDMPSDGGNELFQND